MQKAAAGNFCRNELAFIGAPCNIIQQLAQAVITALPAYKLGYVDASHKEITGETPALPFISLTNQLTHTQVNYAQQPPPLQQRMLFNDADCVLINGNHFMATGQIVIISDAKPLHKKLDRLINVRLVLSDEANAGIPAYLANGLPGINNVPVLSIHDTVGIIKFIEGFILQSTPILNGLVLSGGESTRMGTDKGSIQYQHGISQRQHVYNLLKPLCGDVFVSCNATQQTGVANEGLPLITDSFTGLGPMGGILSAFRTNPNAAWLVVACDLPYLSSNTLQYLIKHRNVSKTATAFYQPAGEWPEPLITIWEPRSYNWLLQLMAQGYSCPRKALINADVAMLHAPDTHELSNANYYNDYITAFNNLHTH